MDIEKHEETWWEVDGSFRLAFEPIEDSLIIKKVKSGWDVRYFAHDENPDSPQETNNASEYDAAFLVHYHDSFCIEEKDVISKDDLRDWYQGKEIEQQKDYYMFPVSALIHSGTWLSLDNSFPSDGGGWDASHVGAILVKKSECKTVEEAWKYAKGLLADWNNYLSGNAYMAIVEQYDKDKQQIDYNVYGGYSGDVDKMKKELGSL